jgi:nucleotide-binding universal stress UspA family protein
MSFSKILIAVDQPPLAFKVYQTGLALAESLGATVNLIHVVDPALAMGSPDLGISPPQALAKLKQEALAFLQQLAQLYPHQGQVFYFVAEGKPDSAILSAAQDYTADLLIMGSHSKPPLQEFLLGSVAASVLRRAPCPVMLIRA